jgi:hypothetical protein
VKTRAAQAALLIVPVGMVGKNKFRTRVSDFGVRRLRGKPFRVLVTIAHRRPQEYPSVPSPKAMAKPTPFLKLGVSEKCCE